ncbi:MAG: GAF domain-containing protein [Chloroflexi bacterium]|nr:GAF domain-containing protein [Chloroflexota bacterium]
MMAQGVQRNRIQSLPRYRDLVGQVLQVFVLGYQVLAILLFVGSLFLGMRWLQRPFLGAFYEHTLVFNGTGPSSPSPEWALYKMVTVGDQLTAINGIPVRNNNDVEGALVNSFPGETVTLTIHTPEMPDRILDVVLHPFSDLSRFTHFSIPSTLSLIFLFVSLWIFGLRRTEPAGRAFSLFTTSLAIVTGTYFNLATTHEFTLLWTLACGIAGGALFDLALSFPNEPRLVINRPYLRWIGLLIGTLLTLVGIPNLFNLNQPTAYIQNWQQLYGFIAIMVVFYIAVNLYHSIYAPSPVVKTQARTIIYGALFAFLPIGLWLGVKSIITEINFSPVLFLPIALFPLVIGYTILRFKFFRTDDFVRRGITYALLTVGVIGGYVVLATSVGLIFSRVSPNNSLLIGGYILAIALVLDPLRARLQGFVDNRFFRGERVLVEQLEDFSHKLATALDLNTIGAILRAAIAIPLNPNRIHVYTYDPLTDQYFALPGDDKQATSDVRFSASSPLARYFHTEKLPLYLDDPAALPGVLQLEGSRLALLGARLFVVLPGKERPSGWLALGTRLSGQPYAPRDLRFLENIGDQASVAIERVQTVAHLERRIQEMNALTRVSQGVNVTLTFDDVLELIYAQTTQILPTSHFHITLYDRTSDYYYYGFCVENNERIASREKTPFSASTDLAPEVIRKSRPIITHDYVRECQARGLTPQHESLFAWMGVPLNAGAESIGALNIGSQDGAVTYTRGQLELLQAIADQTAGAIVKSRLLQETQQRAHQLTTLNEITRQLTGTLELEPLLQNILENAVGILNCEAGSLFLVDEQMDDLIFKVTVGPSAAANLVGQRLPAGTGIVGKAVTSRAPVIENAADRSADRFSGIDEQTGFVSRALMAVPLQVKDDVIGVIEVINRRDGLPFGSDDQALLTAFAGQAAVAIENARLYTLTDQALAARVEELSVMQRIDRELNASLEMDRAMRITLDWALRQSNADAGLIGMLEEDRINVMSQQGFDDTALNLQNDSMHVELPVMSKAIETGQPQRLTVTDGNPKLLPGTHTQIAIPIRRETKVIGLLHLESLTDSQVDMAFLTRLTDHAAIAISNAQLYGEVQQANLAKSDFVSFVAHELKNPMTSIKGYTELLAGGAVGQINEMQNNFLNTIKSNVERMSTLVSDLNDNSKIEAGRLRLEYKATSVSDIVDEVGRSMTRLIEEKKQVMETLPTETIPPIWADRLRVIQVLTNLVSNAYKYTPEEGVIQIGAEDTTNIWDPEGASRVVHLWVKDNGIGMTEEDQQKIFQKFFRSEDPKAREVPGTGLGLNITRSLIEMQGGKIWFESEYRHGTTFHFTIPVAEA